jgi:hypothetical protein
MCMRWGLATCRWWGIAGRRSRSPALHCTSQEPPFPSCGAATHARYCYSMWEAARSREGVAVGVSADPRQVVETCTDGGCGATHLNPSSKGRGEGDCRWESPERPVPTRAGCTLMRAGRSLIFFLSHSPVPDHPYIPLSLIFSAPFSHISLLLS